MEVQIGSTLTVIDPSPELKQWCKENLVLENPEYHKKIRMGFWVGKTPEYIRLYQTNAGNLILPYGVLRNCLHELQFANKVTKTFKEATKVDYGKPVPLYDYQEEAVKKLKLANYGILQSKAGSGKTQMGIALTKLYGVKTLWLTHTLDLLQQSKARALSYMDESLIGTIASGKVDIGKGITFATVQTMSKLDLRQYENEWDLIIVDECHRVAGTPTALTMFYKVLNSLCARHKYGLSATVHRADGLIEATYALLGEVVHTVSDEDVADKTMKVGVKVIETGVRMTYDCLNTDGTINFAKLISYITEEDSRNELIVEELVKNQEHPTLILSDRLKHLELLRDSLPVDMLVNSAMVSGKMNTKKGKEEREEIMNKMRSGKLKYLFATYSLAKEGLDIPCLERLFLVTPQKDYAIVTQSAGRIARISEGKKPPIIYDFVDQMDYLVHMFKKRKTTYNKIGCYYVEDDKDLC